VIKQENISLEDIKIRKTKKSRIPKLPRDIRSVFRAKLKELDIEKLKKSWMAEKSIRLVNTEEALQKWVDAILNDPSRKFNLTYGSLPVVAIDTETVGLDTRIITNIVQEPDGTWSLVYEVKIDIAGICLSADGIEGIYVPINHEDGKNLDRAVVARILQYLCDRAHLIFYNAKFDREVLRICLGLNFRGYPYFEDVQVIQYINDPKADLDEDNKKKSTRWVGDAGNLKALSKKVLGIEQIELEELCKIKADFCVTKDTGDCKCNAHDRKELKHSQRVQYVPFTWVPTDIATWYAASDAICTWLLWKELRELAQSRKLVHRIDHETVETLTWVERQRPLINVDRHSRTVNWHTRKLENLADELRQLAIAAGFDEPADDQGVVLDENKFAPSKNAKVANLLFDIKKFKKIRITPITATGKGGNASTDAEVVEELRKLYPEDDFLKRFQTYKSYVSLHPENLRYDPKDNTARIFIKQNVVAGGRFAAAGGDFPVDGGFGLNPQGIKRVEPYLIWKVKGNVLHPDTIPFDEIEEHQESELHKSCWKTEDEEVDGKKTGVKIIKKAPGIIKNHIGLYTGYAICLVPGCKSCAEKFGVLIPNGVMDANEVVNLRALFCSAPGWTFFSVDYSNIEMRCAANVSGEPEFVKEFLEGKGDFHSLTASKVFPEFNNPATPKEVKKKLRALAKIINFALLYGGTEYAIYENMKVEKPDITWDECKQMVAKYWEGVPVFADFCARKQQIAREEMKCTTSTGRVIDFKSAMETLGIHVPNESEIQNYWEYRGLCKKAEEAKKAGNAELEKKCTEKYNRMWKDADTGVRNVKEYNGFIGKIQRVAVNVPLQGLAGDFMRISLNRIRQWALKDPMVQCILRLHSSIHDEIIFAVKNEYVPFVIPRITRLMKLRKYHTKMGWKVPIECDCEYGTSWDVDFHLTGDDGHKPSGWTHVTGMENYLPDFFEPETVKALLKAIASGETARVEKARTWLKENLHPKAFEATGAIFDVKEHGEIKAALIATLQLHEFWTIDAVPDDADDTMETLEQYEARVGLKPEDRGIGTPEFGFLGAVPLDAKVTRPTLSILGEEVLAEDAQITVSDSEITVAGPTSPESVSTTKAEQGDLLLDVPRKKKPVEKVTIPAPAPKDNIPELKEFDTKDAAKKFREVMGIGQNTVTIRYKSQIWQVPNVELDTVPAEFLKG